MRPKTKKGSESILRIGNFYMDFQMVSGGFMTASIADSVTGSVTAPNAGYVTGFVTTSIAGSVPGSIAASRDGLCLNRL